MTAVFRSALRKRHRFESGPEEGQRSNAFQSGGKGNLAEGNTIRESEKKELCTLIYYPEQKLELIKAGESISFSIQIPVSVAYAVFILMALYKPINDKLIKTVSLLFIVYMAVEGVYTIVTNGAEDSLIRELMASFNYFKYVSYLSGIMVGLTFFLAKYEDAESGAFYSVETKTGVTMASTLGFIHFVLFWTAVTLLNGHQYGLPDKYGSYRRGMYAWETNSADSISSLLWVPIALLCAIAVVHIKTEKYNESQKENGDETPVSTPAIMTFMVAGVLLIGTIFVYYRRSLYN